MGFLNFKKKSKATSPPSVVISNLPVQDSTTDPNYHSPIADSFRMVGSSISDIAQSSLSEDIFNELIPLATRKNSITTSKDTIRHSLSLKSNSNRTSKFPLKINTSIDSKTSSIASPLDESTISSRTRSSKESGSSDSSLTSLSSTEEFVPLHPISRSDPENYPARKSSENAPLIGLLNRASHEQQPVHVNTIPGLAIARMKERHRQEYRRSMQWPPPGTPPPVPPLPKAEYLAKKASSFTNQRIYPMQASPSPPVNNRVQLPLIQQIKPATSTNTFITNPFDTRPLITNISRTNNQPVNYQQPRQQLVVVADQRNFYLDNNNNNNNNQHYAKSMQYQVNATQPQHPRQRLVGITEFQHQQQQQLHHQHQQNQQHQQHQHQQHQQYNNSQSSKLKSDYRRIIDTKRHDSVPDLANLLNDTQQQQQPSASHCSHHQPHHTLIKRQYKNAACCPPPQKQHMHCRHCTHYKKPMAYHNCC